MRPERWALVVDDVASGRLLAEKYLQRLGWQTVSVASGEQALATVGAHPFSLILLDISMPGLSGEETCASLRALPQGRALRIVAYTAHAFPEDRERFLASDFDAVLVKPVERAALAAAVAAVFPPTADDRAG